MCIRDRKSSNVLSSRTAMELRGISCIGLETTTTKRKSCVVSRSFGKRIETFQELKEAVANYCLNASEKDEKINSLMRSIDNTNHRYGRSTLSVASAGVHKKWNMRRQYSSKIDTADFYCLPTIRA